MSQDVFWLFLCMGKLQAAMGVDDHVMLFGIAVGFPILIDGFPLKLLLLLHHQTLHQKVCPTVNISNGNDDCCCVEDVLTVLQAQPGILSAWQQS